MSLLISLLLGLGVRLSLILAVEEGAEFALLGLFGVLVLFVMRLLVLVVSLLLLVVLAEKRE
jgi:hypothetical protein